MDFRQTYHDLVRRDVFPLLPPGSIGDLLDFGGGVGATSADLRASGRATRAVLFDQVAENALPQVDAVEALNLDDGDAVSAALNRTGPFDTILALDILEHLVDPWQTVRLLDGALRPGGSLVISVPNVNNLAVVGPLILKGRFEYADAGVLDRTHLRWFTRRSAIGLATCSGLTLQAIAPNLAGRRHRYANAASLGLLERFFAVQYKLRVRKAG
jgi:2-polyprenyl-3-methyl-5-hydroxy-6-metoxy-1,4-benzoquinol methylase